jgi:hypothetical protein
MIEYHDGHLAINVKDYHDYSPLLEQYREAEFQDIYENCKEAFWDTYAPKVAEEYGYGKIFSEGRSDGWLVVENPPLLYEAEPYYEEMGEEEKERFQVEQAKWEGFSREISAEMEFCCDERLIEVLKETRARKGTIGQGEQSSHEPGSRQGDARSSTR